MQKGNVYTVVSSFVFLFVWQAAAAAAGRRIARRETSNQGDRHAPPARRLAASCSLPRADGALQTGFCGHSTPAARSDQVQRTLRCLTTASKGSRQLAEWLPGDQGAGRSEAVRVSPHRIALSARLLPGAARHQELLVLPQLPELGVPVQLDLLLRHLAVPVQPGGTRRHQAAGAAASPALWAPARPLSRIPKSLHRLGTKVCPSDRAPAMHPRHNQRRPSAFHAPCTLSCSQAQLLQATLDRDRPRTCHIDRASLRRCKTVHRPWPVSCARTYSINTGT